MNTSALKRHGVVYTPAAIVDLILDHVLPSDSDELAAAKVCDPACGDGAFLTAVAHRVLAKLGRDDALSVLRRMTGYDIDRNAVSRCRSNLDAVLNLWYPGEYIDWNLFAQDALQRRLFDDGYGKFTHVVSNPPYVRVQHLEQRGRQRISGQWNVVRGATDLYLVFYELALRLVRSGGTVGYISPSSWLRSDSGSLLRSHLVKSNRVLKVIDCGEHQIFPGVTTYTAITIVQKGGTTEFIPVTKYDGLSLSDGGFVMLDENDPAKPWWMAPTNDDRDRMINLSTHGIPLGKIADIHVGIQTLADRVFIRPAGEIAGMEPWILRPVVKASVLKDGHDPVDRAVIFPYDDKGKLLPEERIADEAPTAYQWLQLNKEQLLNRDKGKFDPARWYAFGRHVSITSGFGDKILTSGMNRRPNFQRCQDPAATFYSGYCIKPQSGVDLAKLLAVLNSDDMEFFIRHTSRPYQGGWMSYAKSFIKDFPVPASVLRH